MGRFPCFRPPTHDIVDSSFKLTKLMAPSMNIRLIIMVRQEASHGCKKTTHCLIEGCLLMWPAKYYLAHYFQIMAH